MDYYEENLTMTIMIMKKIPMMKKITTATIKNTKMGENKLDDILQELNQFQVPHEMEEEQDFFRGSRRKC